MAYVKTTWQTGDVITAEKLNNMEGGIEAVSPEAFEMLLTMGQTENTLTNADKLLSAVNAISEDLTKINSYLPLVTATDGEVTVRYAGRFYVRESNYVAFFTDGVDISYNADDGFNVFGNYTFTEEDIDENGVATLTRLS